MDQEKVGEQYAARRTERWPQGHITWMSRRTAGFFGFFFLERGHLVEGEGNSKK